jgi:hypothetical protein
MSPTTIWVTVLAGSAVCLALKLAGHVVPGTWAAHPRVARTAALVTVALVAVQTVASGRELVIDARLPALAVAAVALVLRAPFIVVVVLAALTAALLRAAGMS